MTEELSPVRVWQQGDLRIIAAVTHDVVSGKDGVPCLLLERRENDILTNAEYWRQVSLPDLDFGDDDCWLSLLYEIARHNDNLPAWVLALVEERYIAVASRGNGLKTLTRDQP